MHAGSAECLPGPGHQISGRSLSNLIMLSEGPGGWEDLTFSPKWTHSSSPAWMGHLQERGQVFKGSLAEWPEAHPL